MRTRLKLNIPQEHRSLSLGGFNYDLNLIDHFLVLFFEVNLWIVVWIDDTESLERCSEMSLRHFGISPLAIPPVESDLNLHTRVELFRSVFVLVPQPPSFRQT